MDEFIGTAGNDVFQGLVEDLSNFDDLVGGEGNDVLNLYVEGEDSVDTPSTVDVAGIETVNFIYDDMAMSYGEDAIDGDTFQGATQIWQINDARTIDDLSATQTAGFRDIDGLDVNVGFSGETGSIALDGVESGADLYIDGADLTTLNVSGDLDGGDEAAELYIDSVDSDTVITTLNLALSTDVVIAGDQSSFDLETFNAAATTGDITFNNGDVTGSNATDALSYENLTFGSGDDEVTLNLVAMGAEEASINTGAGDDVVTIGLDMTSTGEPEGTVLTIDTGAGLDVIEFSLSGGASMTGGGNIASSDFDDGDFVGVANLVSIDAFDEDEDVINLEGFEGFTAGNAVNIALNGLADDATLVDAVEAVAGLVEAGGTNITLTAAFNFDGNTYIYQDEGDAGLDAGDVLIELVGTVALDNNNVVNDFNISA